ncbi:MAG: hypothetical protein ABJZ55_17820 [Fuerstiella sp.]
MSSLLNEPVVSDFVAEDTHCSTSKPIVKIYGERNTGTNYLSALLDLNFRCRQLPGFVPKAVMGLQLLLPGREGVRDYWFEKTFSRNLGWKHMQVEAAERLQGIASFSAALHFLTLTKNPYSWLLSMHRRPYHQHHKTSLSLEEFLVTPWQLAGRDNVSEPVSNPIELWNIKNRSYERLASRFPVLQLTYEAVLCNPLETLQQIEDTFQLQRLNSDLKNYERSTKDSDRDAAYYRDHYLKERWRSKLSRTAVATINQHLDAELVQQFGYSLLDEMDFE